MRYVICLAILLAGCGGYDGPDAEQTVRGVTVTKEVPFPSGPIVDNTDIPPQGDREMPDHHIHRER